MILSMYDSWLSPKDITMCENVTSLATALQDIKLTPQHPLFQSSQALQQVIRPMENSPLEDVEFAI